MESKSIPVLYILNRALIACHVLSLPENSQVLTRTTPLQETILVTAKMHPSP
jgi:hypothetical protein